MASASNIPGAVSPGDPGAAGAAEYNPPPSRPLQIFLFCAFLITVAAYVAGQRSDISAEETANRARNSQLYRAEKVRNEYLADTKRGFQAEDQKQFATAVSNFQSAALLQNIGEAHYNLGHALFLQSRSSDAVKEFQMAVGLDPRLRDAYLSWGQVLVEQGSAADAEKVYRKAIAQSPDFSVYHFKLAQTLAAQNQNAAALDEFDRAARLGLDSPDFALQFGSALSQAGRFADAEFYLAKAAAMKADLPGVQFQLGLAQQQQGNYTNAIARYEIMLTQQPDHPETLNNLALIYATATNQAVRSPRMAVQCATHACAATQEKNPRFLDTLARSYASGGDFSQAAVWENKAIERAKETADPDLLRDLTARYALFQQQKVE